MKSYFYSALALFATLISCTPDVTVEIDEALVNSKTAGQLSVTVLGVDDAPVTGVKVYLYLGNAELYNTTTNDKGIADFGRLNMGTYVVASNDVVLQGVKFSFSKYVQVLSSDHNQVVVRPMEHSGKLTLNINEVIKTNNNIYSSPKPLITGKVALVNYPIQSADFASLMANKVVETSLNGSNNTVVFDKVPQGVYMVMVYFDDKHYSIGVNSNSNGDYYYYQPFYVEMQKENVLSYPIIVWGHQLFDYTGNLDVTAKEVLITGNWSSSYTVRNLTYSNLLLLPGDSYNYSSMSLSQLKASAIAEKAVPNDGSKVAFTNIPINNYTMVAYTDDSHFQFCSNDYTSNSISSFFVAPDVTKNINVYAHAHKLKDLYYSVTCNVYYLSAGQTAKVYALSYDAYLSLMSAERLNTESLNAVAFGKAEVSSGNNTAVMDVKGHETIYFICIASNGKSDTRSETFYGNSTMSLYPY